MELNLFDYAFLKYYDSKDVFWFKHSSEMLNLEDLFQE